jgi:hypothetical protein
MALQSDSTPPDPTTAVRTRARQESPHGVHPDRDLQHRALYAAVMALRCVLVQRRLRGLTPDAAPLPTAETLSVVMPARNEAVDLAAALHSILAQEGVHLEVTVVNDHSTDRTGAIADAIARTDPRVRVIHDPPLPPGWLGKCNAMQQGAAGATGDTLLFADADVVQAPTGFATALRAMRENAGDFFSLWPRLENRTVWEHANIPRCTVSALPRCGPFQDWKTPLRPTRWRRAR